MTADDIPHESPDERSTQRYLAAKRTVDDRALHRQTFDAVVDFLGARSQPVRIIEVAAGVGTMLERMLEWDVLPYEVEYTALDIDPANVAAARERLPETARAAGYEVEPLEASAVPGADTGPAFARKLTGDNRRVRAQYVTADAFEVVEKSDRDRDLLIAGAFLDLVPGVEPLRSLFRAVPDGAIYAPITFDGATRFSPASDPTLDRRIERRFHAHMRDRNQPGDPRAGSRLPERVRAAGGRVEVIGSSAWVVSPDKGRYPADEAYFLRHVLGFIGGAVVDDPELNEVTVRDWLAQRTQQVADAELTYIAHNLDVFATPPSPDHSQEE